ncbi:MAG: ATP-binding protein [Deltaproteobacteria bacterium]|nr:ATP-binding protein [Deltaproteobacteria bacterium]
MEEPFHKIFNTCGPCHPSRHLTVPAVDRAPLARQMVEDGVSFCLKGPRRSGKTTLALELAGEITGCGRYHALYMTLQEARGARGRRQGARLFAEALNSALRAHRDPMLSALSVPLDADTSPRHSARKVLERLCSALDRPLVLFIDEADMLSGDALQSLLDQLTAGMALAAGRPEAFPRCVGLLALPAPDRLPSTAGAGARKAALPGERGRAEGLLAAAASLCREIRLPAFTFAELDRLCELHGAGSGQAVEEAAKLRLWDWTAGAPWPVNAIMAEAVDSVLHGDRGSPVTEAAVDEAARSLLRSTPAPLRRLGGLLSGLPVRRACCEALCGGNAGEALSGGGAELAAELGLLSAGLDDRLRPAGLLCRAIILRELASHIRLPAGLRGLCPGKGGGPDMTAALLEFQRLWRWRAASWREPLADIPGAGEKLSLLAFLEAALPEGYGLEATPSAAEGSLAVTVAGPDKPLPLLIALERPGGPGHQGRLQDLSALMHAAGSGEGWLAFFDLDPAKGPDERIFWKTRPLAAGSVAHVAGL